MTETRRYSVTGMSCEHCESTVRSGVEQLPGISRLEVSADAGRLEITLDENAALADETVLAAVDEAGYEAVRQP